jgi:hypothetical protein
MKPLKQANTILVFLIPAILAELHYQKVFLQIANLSIVILNRQYLAMPHLKKFSFKIVRF